MSVSEERHYGWSRHQRFHRVTYGHDIFIFIDGRSVHKLHIRQSFDPHWALRQRTQPLQILRSELIVGPLRSQSGHGIKIGDVDQTAHRLVVITADKELAQLARARNNFVGTRPIAHDIAQIEDQVERGSGREASIKSFEIAMNIAKQKYAH